MRNKNIHINTLTIKIKTVQLIIPYAFTIIYQANCILNKTIAVILKKN